MTAEMLNQIEKRMQIAIVLSWDAMLIDVLSQKCVKLRQEFRRRIDLALASGQWRGKVIVWKDEMQQLLKANRC